MEAIQLARFNATWSWCQGERAFYRHWKTANSLPEQIADLSELDSFPQLTKTDIRENEDLIFAESSRGSTYTTGGSTAEPTLFPRDPAERAEQYADNYVGRAWWGIGPTDRRVLVWGHSHLYGTGLRSVVSRADRGVRDRLTNTLRLDGYRISEADARDHLDAILRFKPTNVVGYSSALHRIALAASVRDRAELASLRLRGVVATAETLTANEAETISSVFGCPVIIEYGAAEAGVLAVSRETTWNIEVLWNSHILRQPDERGAVISTLKARRFPLINFSLGDEVLPAAVSESGSIFALTRINGRINESVSLRQITGGTRAVSALQITHILKGHDATRAVQFSQARDNAAVVHIELRSDGNLRDVTDHLLRTISAEYPDLDTSAITVRQEQNQQYTLAGKHRVMRLEG